MSEGVPLWRCFPWDPLAAAGAPFSPSYIAKGQTAGRFDLGDQPPVLYLAESPEHAVGELLAEFRGTRFRPEQLERFGRTLAVAPVHLGADLWARVPDCTAPEVLAALGLRPDRLAHHDRSVTQAVARELHEQGHAGLHWWSSLTGAWHATVLFMDRVSGGQLRFADPEALHPTHPGVLASLPILGIRTA